MPVKHKSDLAFCKCRMCNSGMHTKYGGFLVQYARRQQRRKTKEILRRAIIEDIEIDVPKRFPAGYTD